jgi:hypothetical protein
MALLTLAELKRYQRVQTTLQDTLLAEILAESVALTEQYLNQPITAAARTIRYPVGALRGVSSLVLPSHPTSTTITVADPNGDTVDADDYEVDRYAGMVFGLSSYRFGYGEHRITATMGLSGHPDYATRIEPVVNAGIRDYAADLYLRRNPAAAYETAGAGVSVTYNESANQGLPPRIKTTLAPWRRRNV